MSNAQSKQARRLAAQEAAKRRRTRNILIAVVFVVVVVAGIVVFVASQTPTDSSATAPAGVLSDLGIPVGTATTPVVDLYEDFQCPVCKAFEDNVGPTLRQLIDNGQVRAVYHILSFLDTNLHNDSSTRAANAAGCAQDQGVFEAFHNQVYANQPATEGAGYTDDQLIAFGQAAGVPDMATFQTCVTNHTYAGWVAQVERLAENKQVSSTPSVFVDGKLVDLGQASSWADYATQLTTAIQQAG
jgi:protein-disulfide isomerase